MSERFGFNIWTKNKPKDYIDLFINYAAKENGKLIPVIDDVLPKIVFERSNEESIQMNNLYIEYFSSRGASEAIIVSDMPELYNITDKIIEICNEVSLQSFISILPQSKINELDSLKMTEIIEAAWQIYILRAATKSSLISCWLTGKRSTALFRLIKRITPEFDFKVID